MSNLFNKVAIAIGGAFVLALTGFGATAVFADSPGQLGGGSDVLVAKNVTAGGSYAGTVSTSCNDVVQYSVRLHNLAFGGLTNINVSANLGSGTVTAVPAEGASAGTNGSVTVNLPSGASLAYENGSATLYNESGAVIKTLTGTITSGVNIGDLPGSTTEFVNYRAKVTCPTPVTVTTTPTQTTTVTKSPAKAVALPNTGAGDVLGIFAGASAAGTAAHMAVTSRRNRR
jgi:hypothetical protein